MIFSSIEWNRNFSKKVARWHCSNRHQNHYAYTSLGNPVVTVNGYEFWNREEAYLTCKTLTRYGGNRPRVKLNGSFIKYEELIL